MIKKKISIGICLALVAAILASIIVFLYPNFYESFEFKTLDLRFRLRGDLPQNKDILFLEMDEPSIKALGRWPWPRDIFAHIVDTLTSLKAKAVLFDILFAEPTQPAIDRLKLKETLALEENKKPLDDIIAASLLDNDRLFAESIQNSGNVYLSSHFEIIYSPSDIKKAAAFDKIKNSLNPWIEKNPYLGASHLPSNLTQSTEFTPNELHTIFNKIKLQYLISRNLELTLDDAAVTLEEQNVASLRPLYNECKREVFREQLTQSFKKISAVTLDEIIATLGLTSSTDIQLLKEVHQDALLKEIFEEKIGLENTNQWFYNAFSVTFPILPFTKAMKSSGHLNAITDNDGTLRKVPLFVRHKDKIYPHIAFRLACDILGADLKTNVRIVPGSIIIGTKHIPMDRHGCILLNWAGKWADSFHHLPAAEVHRLWELQQAVTANQRLSAEELADEKVTRAVEDVKLKLEETKLRLGPLIKDKICIIGLTAPGTHDYTPIPLEPNYPAVGAHATIINSILQGKFLSRVDPIINYALIFILAFIAALLVSSLAPLISLLGIILVLCFYGLLSFVIFNRYGLWIDVVGPLAGCVLSYVGITSFTFAGEQKEKLWIKKAFSRYISKSVMDEILKDPSKLKLGGENKELTSVFIDVRGFTAYSEKHTPEEIVFILNEYLDEMTRIIFAHDGTLDKYVGDEIMVIFGAPIGQNDHAKRAVIMALDMLARIRQLQDKWRVEGKEPLDIGIGINTGPMIVGNMGSMERMNYTVIGDAVNLASRIQALTRTYNNHIMISEFTYAHIKDAIEVKPLEAIKVKGKENPVMMYEVLGRK